MGGAHLAGEAALGDPQLLPQGLEILHALHLHHAHPAGAVLVDVLQVAKGGDVDAVLPGGLQDGGALLGLTRLSVYGQIQHHSYLLSQCRQRRHSAMASRLW